MMDAKPNRRALSLGSFVILYLGYMLLFADRTVLNLSLAAIGKDFSVSPAALGATSSVFFLGYTIMQIPGGWLTDRFSSRKVIIATLAFWSVMTIFTGLAWSLAALLVIRFLFGIAEGPYPPAAMKQVAQDFPVNKRAQLTAALISSNYAGAALAPFIIVPIIAATGWRSAFFWLGVFGLLLMVSYLFFRCHGAGLKHYHQGDGNLDAGLLPKRPPHQLSQPGLVSSPTDDCRGDCGLDFRLRNGAHL